MARPRLLHVFPGFDLGGSQARLVMLAKAWGERFEHHIVSSDGSFGAFPLLAAVAPAQKVADAPPMKGQGLWATLRSFARYLEHSSPELLLTYNWGAIEVALANRLFARLPHVHHEDGFGPDEVSRQNPRRVWFRRAALWGGAPVVVPSLTLERMATGRWRLPRRQVRFIPNGVDLSLFDAPPAAQAIPGFARRPGEVIVGCVGGLRPEKNPARLVRAFAAAAKGQAARLVLVGSGSERGAVESLAKALGIADQLVLPGFVPEPHRYMGLIDIYAIPSDTEQFPISQVEAMAAGRVVTGMDVGDVAVILPDASRRWVAPAGDEAALAAHLAALIAAPDVRAASGAANRAHVAETYPLARTISAFEALYGAHLRA